MGTQITKMTAVPWCEESLRPSYGRPRLSQLRTTGTVVPYSYDRPCWEGREGGREEGAGRGREKVEEKGERRRRRRRKRGRGQQGCACTNEAPDGQEERLESFDSNALHDFKTSPRAASRHDPWVHLELDTHVLHEVRDLVNQDVDVKSYTCECRARNGWVSLYV